MDVFLKVSVAKLQKARMYKKMDRVGVKVGDVKDRWWPSTFEDDFHDHISIRFRYFCKHSKLAFQN